MKTSVLSLVCGLLLFGCSAEEKAPLPSWITELPIGLKVDHSQQEVAAVLNSDYPERGGVYKWKYQTFVTALNDDLEMREFGGLSLENGRWKVKTIYTRPFTKEEFAEWYSCPEGKLLKGQVYTDANNWSTSNEIPTEDSKSLAYYIAVDKEGNEFVGYKEIVLKAMLEEH